MANPVPMETTAKTARQEPTANRVPQAHLAPTDSQERKVHPVDLETCRQEAAVPQDRKDPQAQAAHLGPEANLDLLERTADQEQLDPQATVARKADQDPPAKMADQVLPEMEDHWEVALNAHRLVWLPDIKELSLRSTHLQLLSQTMDPRISIVFPLLLAIPAS